MPVLSPEIAENSFCDFPHSAKYHVLASRSGGNIFFRIPQCAISRITQNTMFVPPAAEEIYFPQCAKYYVLASRSGGNIFFRPKTAGKRPEQGFFVPLFLALRPCLPFVPHHETNVSSAILCRTMVHLACPKLTTRWSARQLAWKPIVIQNIIF